jgi:hypothetical protein
MSAVLQRKVHAPESTLTLKQIHGLAVAPDHDEDFIGKFTELVSVSYGRPALVGRCIILLLLLGSSPLFGWYAR